MSLYKDGVTDTRPVKSTFTARYNTRARLTKIAFARKTTFGRLVSELLDKIVDDDLFKAVMDED